MTRAGRVDVLAWTLVASVLADEVEARGGAVGQDTRALLAACAAWARGPDRDRAPHALAVDRVQHRSAMSRAAASSFGEVYLLTRAIANATRRTGLGLGVLDEARATGILRALGVASPRDALDATLADARRAAEKELR